MSLEDRDELTRQIVRRRRIDRAFARAEIDISTLGLAEDQALARYENPFIWVQQLHERGRVSHTSKCTAHRELRRTSVSQWAKRAAEIGRPILYDVLISHAQTEDGELARALVEKLEAQGVRCWVAPRDIPPGMTWNSGIADAIEKSRFVLPLISAAAINSKFVSAEVVHGFDAGCAILPVRIQAVDDYWRIDLRLKTIQPIDYFDRAESALADIFSALRARKVA
jgi:TIR domain